MKLILENFRSFAGRHEIPIKPLTLLIGENSTGKTSVLAGLQIVSDNSLFPFGTTFRDAPYKLGTFETIRYDRGDGISRSNGFALGYAVLPNKVEAEKCSIVASFVNEFGSPMAHACDMNGLTRGANIHRTTTKDIFDLSIGTDSDTAYLHYPMVDQAYLLGPHWIHVLPMVNLSERMDKEVKVTQLKANDATWFSWGYPFLGELTIPAASSIGPIRSQPDRTYDLAAPRPGPEGEETPYVLDHISQSDTDPIFGLLRQMLATFGADSGLFGMVGSNRVGTNGGSRFELIAEIDGVNRNIVDVGYGVGQVLPVLIRSIAGTARRTLIQQPEVHLHPKAQAALGSFFAELAGRHNRQFVIETHSDYLLDRIRIEVAKGTISHEDVAFLYFERGENGTKWFDLGVDAVGNITNAPQSYRDFFFAEQDDLLTRGAL